LYRLEVDKAQNQGEKAAMLAESVACLSAAITLFSDLEGFGPNDPEVGDCYSLLGRTRLVARDLKKAEDAVRKAYQLITDAGSKDYLDLVILSGDLEAARGDSEAAESFYDDALSLPATEDSETTEMRARAFFQRGLNRKSAGRRDQAVADF